MAGEVGISVGINEGLNQVNKSLINAEQIKSNRDEKRQEAYYRQEALGMQRESHKQQSDYNAQALEQMKMKVDAMSNELIKEKTYNYMSAFKKTGEAKYLNMAYKSNPALQSAYPNITSLDSPLDYADDVLTKLGADKEIINADKGRYVIATDASGGKKLVDMYGIYAQTGVLNIMEKDEQDKMKYSLDVQKTKLQMQQAQSSMATDAMQRSNLSLDNQSKRQKLEMDKLLFDDVKEWLQANPDMRYTDYQTKIANQSDPSKMKAMSELEDKKKADSVDQFITQDPDKFKSLITSANKSDKVTIGDKEYSMYEVAKKYQTAMDKDNKLDTSYMSELRGKRNVILGSDRVLSQVDKLPEWNLSTKLSSEAESVVGDFVKSLGNDVSKNQEAGAKAETELKRLGIESYMFPVIADYIKAMSGAAVAEGERASYMKNMTAGWMSDKSALKTALGGFRSSVNDSFDSSLDTLKTTHPRTYLDLRVDNAPASKSEEGTSSSSSTPTDYPMGTRIESNGKVYVRTAKGWESE